MKWKSRIVAGVGALVLVSTTVVPAHAAVQKSGTRTCSPEENAVARAYADGNVTVQGPGRTVAQAAHAYHSTFKVLAQNGPGGYWKASVTGGALDDVNTYAYCQ